MKRKAAYVRSQALDYDVEAASNESGLLCPEPTLTQQQFAEESDINFIAERYGLTGEMPQVLDLPQYGDFNGIFDFQTAQNAVVHAKQQFMTLPAKMRARFDNDPTKLMAFLDNPDNRAEAEFLGLVQKRPEEVPQSPRSDPAPKGQGDLPPPEPKGSGDLPPQDKPKGKN